MTACPQEVQQADEIVSKLLVISQRRLEVSKHSKADERKSHSGALMRNLVASIANRQPVLGMQHHSASLRCLLGWPIHSYYHVVGGRFQEGRSSLVPDAAPVVAHRIVMHLKDMRITFTEVCGSSGHRGKDKV